MEPGTVTAPADRSRRRAVTTVIVAVASMLLVVVLPSAAVHGPAGGVTPEPLTDRHGFTDEVSVQVRLKPEGRARDVVNLHDAQNMAVLRITIEPGGRFPWHTHPGPVLAAVTEGELVYVYADDCVERSYVAGEAFVDPGGDNVHTAFNPTDGETVVVATFLGAPDGDAPLTIPVGAEEQAVLDERCSDH